MRPLPQSGAEIRVRMYHVGFGDCFLLSLPTRDGIRHVLIDCGVHPSHGRKRLQEVVHDIAEETDKKLALVVATQEHADHISGFGMFARAFAEFDVDQLWMPWAMNLDDPRAAELRKRRLRLADQLYRYVTRLRAKKPPYVRDIVLNVTANTDAMISLRSGFSGRAKEIRYLRADDPPRIGKELPGIQIRVLAPPADDAFLKRMDPPSSQRYFRAPTENPSQKIGPIRPFGNAWRLSLRRGRTAFGFGRPSKGVSEAEIRDAATESEQALAFTLDSAANNTGLALLISVGGRDLLFPSDAQWGSWQSWLDSPSCPSLDNVRLLKVGQHGSANATPRKALEAMRDPKLVAMVSTQDKRPFRTIPQPQLMERLAQRVLVRSDAALDNKDSRVRRGPFWTDYRERL